MKKKKLCWWALAIFLIPLQAYAENHTSHDSDSENNHNLEYSESNPYIVKGRKVNEEDISLFKLLPSELETFSDDLEMNHSKNGHEKHQKSKIELSKYKWVPRSQEGYSLAVAITFLVGLAFTILTIRRSA